RLERHQGALDHRPVRPGEGALLTPLAPAGFRLPQCGAGFHGGRGRQVRGRPSEHERYPVAFAHGEVRHRLEAFAARADRRLQPEEIGTGDRLDAAVDALHPRDDGAVPEPDEQLHANGDPAEVSYYDTQDAGLLAVEWPQF